MSFNVNVCLEKITPQMSSEWLECLYTKQRSVRKQHVEKLTREIVNGNWRVSPDCITLVKGELLNGQHRLLACVAANKTIDALVMRSNDSDLYRIIDSGKSRTIGDVIDFQHANTVAAIANLTLRYFSGNVTRMGGRSMPSRSEIMDFILSNRDALQHIAGFVQNLTAKRPIIPGSLAGALWMITPIKKREDATRFIEQVFTGKGDVEEATIIRERFIKDKMSSRKINKSYAFGLLIKAFNSFANGIGVKTFKILDGEEFPKITK